MLYLNCICFFIIVSETSKIVSKKFDRYMKLCAAAAFVIIMTMLFSNPGSDNAANDETLGIIYDVKESSKGFVFKFQNTEGVSIKCYYSKEVTGGTYMVKGKYSEDRTIFFVSSVRPVK